MIFALEGNVTTEEPKVDDGVTLSDNEDNKSKSKDTDAAVMDKRKSQTKSVTLIDEASHNNLGMLCSLLSVFTKIQLDVETFVSFSLI